MKNGVRPLQDLKIHLKNIITNNIKIWKHNLITMIKKINLIKNYLMIINFGYYKE
jgi:hypothetical protein